MIDVPTTDRMWTRDGRTAHVPVRIDGTVVIAYEVLQDLLRAAGFTETTEETQ